MSSLPSPDRDSTPKPPAADKAGQFAELFAQLESVPDRAPVEDAGQHLGSWLSSALEAVPERATAPRDPEFERHQAELLARSQARGRSRPSPATPGPRVRPDGAAGWHPGADSAPRGARPRPPRQPEPNEIRHRVVGESRGEVSDPDPVPRAELGSRPPQARPVSASPPAESADEDLQNVELVDRILVEVSRLPALAGLALHFSAVRGHVTVAGDLRSDYERQLVRHFVRSVRGVAELTDLMRVPAAGTSHQPVRATPPTGGARRPGRRVVGGSLAMPPNAKWVAGLILVSVLAWTGLSFAKRGDGLPQPQPTKGQVVLPGGSLAGALVTLHPTQPGLAARPRATLKDDGRFELTTQTAGDGAPEGEYIVTAVQHQVQMVDGEPVPGPNQLPAQFAKPETSPLRVSIQRGTNELPPLRLSP